MEDPYAQYEIEKRAWIPQMHRRSTPFAQIFSEQYNTPGSFRDGKETRDNLEFLYNIESSRSPNIDLEFPSLEAQEKFDEIRRLAEIIDKLKYNYDVNIPPEYYNFKQALADYVENERNNDVQFQGLMKNDLITDVGGVIPERFTMTYNTPENFRAGWESRDILRGEDNFPETRVYYDEDFSDNNHNTEYGSGASSEPGEIFRELKNLREQSEYSVDGSSDNSDSSEIFRELKHLNDQQFDNDDITDSNKQPKIYTEGGVFYIPETKLGEYCFIYMNIRIKNKIFLLFYGIKYKISRYMKTTFYVIESFCSTSFGVNAFNNVKGEKTKEVL